MKTLIIFLAFIGIYLLMQLYILPKLGISTRTRDACQEAGKKEIKKK